MSEGPRQEAQSTEGPGSGKVPAIPRGCGVCDMVQRRKGACKGVPPQETPWAMKNGALLGDDTHMGEVERRDRRAAEQVDRQLLPPQGSKSGARESRPVSQSVSCCSHILPRCFPIKLSFSAHPLCIAIVEVVPRYFTVLLLL